MKQTLRAWIVAGGVKNTWAIIRQFSREFPGRFKAAWNTRTARRVFRLAAVIASIPLAVALRSEERRVGKEC